VMDSMRETAHGSLLLPETSMNGAKDFEQTVIQEVSFSCPYIGCLFCDYAGSKSGIRRLADIII
jgi:hypothetical protein